MAGRTMFNFRVLRCPSCNATLPVAADDVMVICEYCEAHVQVARAKAPAAAPTAPTPPAALASAGAREPAKVLVAKPHASVFAWLLSTFVLIVSFGGVIFATVANSVDKADIVELLSSFRGDSGASSAKLAAATGPTPVGTQEKRGEKSKKTKKAKKAKKASEANEAAAEGSAATIADATPPETEPENKTETETKTKAKTKTPKTAKLAEPTGPVLAVPDAQEAIKGAILACMREHKVHDILAYMGNSKVGAVRVLGDSRTRVDGVREKIKGGKLGACMDRAGATVRVRAFKSNYLRFSLVNDALPDPLGHLPEKSNRAEIDRIIATADPQVLECAKKHGEEGAKEIFMFTIDGPSGKPTSVSAGYRGRAFKKCAEPLYKALRFPKVREWTIKVTKHLQM